MASKDSTLRIIHVTMYVLTFSGALMTCLGLGWATRILNNNCVLYSTMEVTKAPNNTIRVVVADSQWGDLAVCDYCTFSAACTASYAIIWFWFYLLLSDWKESAYVIEDTTTGAPPDARLLLPSLLFNGISWVVAVVSLGFITVGRRQWCNSIAESSGKPCHYISDVTWSNNESGTFVYTYVLIAVLGNWIVFGALSCKVGIASARLYRYVQWDFQLQDDQDEKEKVKCQEYQELQGSDQQEIAAGSINSAASVKSIPDTTCIHRASHAVAL